MILSGIAFSLLLHHRQEERKCCTCLCTIRKKLFPKEQFVQPFVDPDVASVVVEEAGAWPLAVPLEEVVAPVVVEGAAVASVVVSAVAAGAAVAAVVASGVAVAAAVVAAAVAVAVGVAVAAAVEAAVVAVDDAAVFVVAAVDEQPVISSNALSAATAFHSFLSIYNILLYALTR
jgi:hypothetical protein